MTRIKGTISRSQPSETHYVKLNANRQYIIDLGGDGAARLRDPALTLVGENGEYAEDANSGPGKRAQITITPQKSQFFDVTVLGENGATGGYLLEINVDDFRNRVLGEAPYGEITPDGRGRKGVIDYSGDADVHALSLIAGLTYGLRAAPTKTGGNEVNPDIALLDEQGRVLARDDESGPGKSAFLVHRARETGDYWIKVEAGGDGTGDYSLRAGVGRGSERRDVIVGSDGGDWANLLGGDDVVRSGLGGDRLWGASGDDMLDGGDDRDSLYGGSGRDKLLGGLGADLLDGDVGRDMLDGGDDSDNLYGGDGADALFGGLGNDGLYGDLGRDQLDGGDGNDRLYGGDGDDVARGGLGRDQLSDGLGDDRLHGGEGSDSVYGGEGNDRLFGGTGDDYIDDFVGDNVMRGGEGDDTIYGGEGQDDISGGASGDYLSGGDGDDLIAGGEGDDTLDGGDGNDRLAAGQGADNVYGGDGDDVIVGGRDGDSLYGGGGFDVFVFMSRADLRPVDPETIWDFQRAGPQAGDVIDLSAIDADRRAPGDDAFRFDDGRGRGTLWLEDDGGKRQTATLVFFNTNGDAEADGLIRIEDGKSVRAEAYSPEDFVF